MSTGEAFELFFDSPDAKFAVMVENDGRTVWAYLRTHDTIVADVWLYNVLPAPGEFDTNPDRTRAPLNPARYCSPNARPVIHDAGDLEIEWTYVEGGELRKVELFEAGDLLARLAPGMTPGWSRFAAIDGPCARRLRPSAEPSAPA
jgi:hypothetical protein